MQLGQNKNNNKKKDLHERAFEKVDPAKELKKLMQLLDELKIQYEQYFLGIVSFPPDKLHREVRMQIRHVRKAPFKKPHHRYRLRMLEYHYNTYNDYWQRVLRKKENGTYEKDIFKANLKERIKNEEKEALTKKGKASKAMMNLFQSYKQALEKETGKKYNIDFDAFQKTLVARARAQQNASKKEGKLSFKVVVKDGRVLVKATLKDS
ncbi:MAG: hypothetical protein ACOX2O_04980 [Bdellovibrionota bacterium]|jgi:hypothetical protein